MCLAIYKPAGITIPEDHLERGFDSNPHGAGFAYVDPERGLVIEKGFFKFKKFIAAWRKVDTLQAVVHFRFATHGKRNEANCHPFPVTPDLCMVHNGIIDIDCSKARKKSDTWHFVEQVVKPFVGHNPDSFFTCDATRLLVEEYVRGSKLVFLASDGRFSIFNEKLGDWDKGVWYSNTCYRAWRTVRGFGSLRGGESAAWGGWEDDYAGEASCYFPAVAKTLPDGTLRRGGEAMPSAEFNRYKEWAERAAKLNGLRDGDDQEEIEAAIEAMEEHGELENMTPEERFAEIPLSYIHLASDLWDMGYSRSEIMDLWDEGGETRLQAEIDAQLENINESGVEWSPTQPA